MPEAKPAINSPGPHKRTAPLKTIAYTALVFVVIFLLLECLSRVGLSGRLVPARSHGTGNPELEIKLSLLSDYVQENGRVDCVFLGPSTIMRGVNPEVFQKSYKDIARKDVTVFNFGINAIEVVSTSMLAEIIVESFSPTMLIITPPQLYEGDKMVEGQLLGSPWIRYRRGSADLEGWLYEHLFSYGYLKTLKTWIDRRDFYKELQSLSKTVTPSGYNPSYVSEIDEQLSRLKPYRKSTKTLAEENSFSKRYISALEDIFELKSRTDVVFMQIPLPPAFLTTKQGALCVISFIETKRLIEERGFPLLRFNRPDLVPLDGWKNLRHLNDKGATIFSEWIGRKLAKAVAAGEIPDPAPHRKE